MTIGKQSCHYLYDATLGPAARVEPGAKITFETLDTCAGEVRTVEEFLARRKSGRPSNPLTGPVYVEGARPADTLTVEILDVEVDGDGFQLIGPQRGIVRREVENWTCHAFRVQGGCVVFPNGIEVPIDPVIGSFGNAPLGEPTLFANRMGGNLDAPVVRRGAKLYIPVAVPGGLFSLGDVHACQGDGEVVGAPEIGARVTVQIGLLAHSHSEWCMVEDADEWHSLCAGATEADAARTAVLQNARLIERTRAVDLADALVILTMIGRISVCRTGDWRGQEPVVCASFSKGKLARALQNYRMGTHAWRIESRPSLIGAH